MHVGLTSVPFTIPAMENRQRLRIRSCPVSQCSDRQRRPLYVTYALLQRGIIVFKIGNKKGISNPPGACTVGELFPSFTFRETFKNLFIFTTQGKDSLYPTWVICGPTGCSTPYNSGLFSTRLTIPIRLGVIKNFQWLIFVAHSPESILDELGCCGG